MRSVLVVLLLIHFPLPALAEEGAPALRIATFDLGRVEKESARKREGVKAIDARFAADKAAFSRLQAECRQAAEEFRNSIYRPGSPEHRKQLARVRELDRAATEKGRVLAGRLGAAKTELLMRIHADLDRAVTALAKAEGYDLVLQVQKPSAKLEAADLARQLNATAVFYAHPRFDVTARIVEAMNRAYEEERKAAKPAK
jgi:Skp family chaperone for outer membrane proteins